MSEQYLELCRDILENGTEVENRTGVNTVAVFGREVRYDLEEGFPLLTTKKTWFKGAVVELLWMLSGSTNVKFLHEHKVHFWDQWATEEGEIGPLYGYMWRNFPGIKEGTSIDQISTLVENLKKNPMSRRHVVSLWYPDLLPIEGVDPVENARQGRQALAPCHWMWEVNCTPVDDTYKLNLHAHLRSNDIPAGHPINTAFYALLTHMLAIETGYEVGELWITMTDAHIYTNQIEGIEEQLSREPYPFPQLVIKRKAESIFDWKVDDFELDNYIHHPGIKFPVAK